MAKVYGSICVEIDDLLLKIMRLSEQLIECKLKVETVMNNGFVGIAKARYIMGSNCVSTLQLPTKQSNPINPLVTVCRTKCDGFWMFEQQRSKVSSPKSDEKIGNDATKTVIKDLLHENGKGIRKRKDTSVDDSDSDLNRELQDEESTHSFKSTASSVGFSDPIRLFGMLVPHTLRVAQKDFQEVIKLLMHCATLQSETNLALDRYSHLMEVKNLIIKAAKVREFDLDDGKECWMQSEEPLEGSDISTDVEPKLKEIEMQVKEKEHESERKEEKLLKFETEELIGSIKRFEILESSAKFIHKECKDENEKDSENN